MPFEQVPRQKKRSAIVVEQILAAIQVGEFTEGSKLPSERELTEKMGVSRNSIREALSALQLSGILETHTGSGTYVAQQRTTGIESSRLLDQVRKSLDLIKVWEARREIEVSLVRLVVERADLTCLDKVSEALIQMQLAIDNSVDAREYLDLNKCFHYAIADCADNPPLREAYGILEGFTHDEMLHEPNQGFITHGMSVSQKDHEEIVAALLDSDANRAVSAVRIHYGGLEKYIKRQYTGEDLPAST